MWYLIILIVLLIPLLAVLGDSPFGRALARRLERGGVEPALAERVEALEREIERLSGEVDRLREGTEFLERLLKERPPPNRLESGEPGG